MVYCTGLMGQCSSAAMNCSLGQFAINQSFFKVSSDNVERENDSSNDEYYQENNLQWSHIEFWVNQLDDRLELWYVMMRVRGIQANPIEDSEKNDNLFKAVNNFKDYCWLSLCFIQKISIHWKKESWVILFLKLSLTEEMTIGNCSSKLEP